ncbi:MAG: Membrane-bound lytic murein transglycosylase [Lacunisphaera sp.]|nr:Membrane-bound lytic murein transglycosylase [Lacunisphaera sp.]
MLTGSLAMGAEPAPQPAPAEPEISADDVYRAGKSLFDTFAPPEVKAQYEFPDKAQWDAFAARLQAALDGDSFEALAQYEPEARAALAAMRAISGAEDYADWLAERLDYVEMAGQLAKQPPAPAKPATQFIPHYDLWIVRMQARPRPGGAEKYVPLLRPVFSAGRVPADLVWLAEVESTFNPAAHSPAGAAGLFQLMPATAKELGLKTFLPDERRDPQKSAQAAARLLRNLHEKFHDWPLALAAYNAGAGRVQRALEIKKARTFAEISPALSVETRLYVPKVLATLQVRAGVSLETLAAPR